MVGASPALQRGARADRQGRAHRRRGCSSPARTAPARSWSPAALHEASPRRDRAVRRGELRRDPVGADRERAVRPHEGLVHRRHRRSRREVRAGRRRHAVPRRGRRHVASRRRPSCCGCCRRASSPGSAAPSRSRWTSACSPRRTRISRRRSRRAASARTCSTGSTWCRSTCRRCASGARTFPRWSRTSPSSWRASAGVPRQDVRRRGGARGCRHARWPGNIRELRNAVERLLILAPGKVVTAADVERLLPAARCRRPARQRCSSARPSRTSSRRRKRRSWSRSCASTTGT